jgi:hypothetical protein
LPLIWDDKGFAFLAASVDADPVTEAALDDLHALFDDLRRKGNLHDDLYSLADELQARSACAVPDLDMVRLHLSYQKLRRLHASRTTRDDPFDAETVATIEAVFDVLPGVTLADAGVRTLIERQDAERATLPPAPPAPAFDRGRCGSFPNRQAAWKRCQIMKNSNLYIFVRYLEIRGHAHTPGRHQAGNP